MTVPAAPLAAQDIPRVAASSARRQPTGWEPRHSTPGVAPLTLAPIGLRPSAPSGDRAVGLVRCEPATERALDALPVAYAATDAAERRVLLATVFLLCWGAAEVLVPGMWVGAALAMVLVVAALWRFRAARGRLDAARVLAWDRLVAEGCHPPEIRWLTMAPDDCAPARRAPTPSRATSPRRRLRLVR